MATTLALGGLATEATDHAAAAEAERLAVDFSVDTGEFRGGASGTLYGLGDEGVPTAALLNGAAITNTSQKAPYGTQHPSGDALKVEDGFFAKHGEDMYIYIQDYYPDWPYHGGVRPGDTRTYNQADGSFTETPNGVWDFLEVVEFVTEAVAVGSSRPQDYVFIPFNEPDGGNWYPNWGTQKDQFLQDWRAVHQKVQEVWQRNGLGHARIGGPGDTRWQYDRSSDFLDFAKANDVLPDVFIWHELGIDNLGSYRRNFAEYRAMEEAKGIAPIHVNITEYGMLRDMAVPGQLIQWLAMFEDTKVDAQVAYWNYAGNLSDNTARPNGANGGWWMFKWYGDLAGSRTVQVTPPAPNVPDSLQGMAAVDAQNRRATVLFGGTDNDVALDLTGLDPEVFGDAVDVEVREATLVGAEGLAATPRVVRAVNGLDISGGNATLDVDVYDRYAGYQVIITPALERDVEAAAAEQPWSVSIEAEETSLTAAQVYVQDPRSGGGWKFLASGGRDVGSFNQVASRSEWTVTVPRDGTYRYQVIGGAPGVPGRHALFVDGEFASIVQYAADLGLNATSRWQYRGSAEVEIELPAGVHTLSLRPSRDGTTRLPNSDITLDKFSLFDVTDGEPTIHPASTFRLFDGATIGPDGAAEIAAGQRADLYVSAWDTGFHDVELIHRTAGAGSVQLSVNGRAATTIQTEAAGLWRSVARVHLVEGINELELRSAEGTRVVSLQTTRAAEGDAAQVVIEAEDGTVAGTAEVVTLGDATGTNASGSSLVQMVGQGPGNYLEIPRAAGFDEAGDYDISVHYANAEVSGQHDYNPQVVDRLLQVHESGEEVGRAYFRYTYSWNSFFQRAIQVSLATGDSPLRLLNTEGWAPNIDKLTIAPLSTGTPTSTRIEEPGPDPSEEPSEEPSEGPSEEPSEEPTEAPSKEPSQQPSTAPSAQPSSRPSWPHSAPGSIYETPGFHQSGGRWWYTECEPYSQTLRCRTDIWSTQTRLVGGAFVSETGWHFNNLTYLPFMKRAQWGGNPLGHTGEWTTEGRRWRTECDTAATGRNGCRSYVWTNYVAAVRTPAGAWDYRPVAGWVFNNIVKFSD